jgi:hypothetical protein
MKGCFFLFYLTHAWQKATCDSVEYAIILSAKTSITVERNVNLKKERESNSEDYEIHML